jgi:3-hydroxybutyryl-CoA dehydrogenase
LPARVQKEVDMELNDVKKIFVVGAGGMGSGLAQVYAHAGFEVSLYSRTQQTLDKAMALITSSLQTFAEEDMIDSHAIQAIVGRIKRTTSLQEGVENADIAVETIVENAVEKKKIFKQLDDMCPGRTIIASNTSFLNIFEFAEVSRQDKLLIAHWYMPPQLIPLVEVVKGPKTSKDSLQLVVNLLKRMGKKPAVMEKFIPGFVINRLQVALQREVHYLVDNDYMSPAEIDEAAKWGLALRMLVLGILKRMDYGGIDLSVRNLNNPNTQPVPVDYKPRKMVELYEKGHFGVKSGRGWYDYEGKSEAQLNRERDLALIRLLKSLTVQ